MTPEEKLELIKLLLGRGVEVRTRYKPRRVVAVERLPDLSYVVVRYDDGTEDKLRLQHFASRRFVAVI